MYIVKSFINPLLMAVYPAERSIDPQPALGSFKRQHSDSSKYFISEIFLKPIR